MMFMGGRLHPSIGAFRVDLVSLPQPYILPGRNLKKVVVHVSQLFRLNVDFLLVHFSA